MNVGATPTLNECLEAAIAEARRDPHAATQLRNMTLWEEPTRAASPKSISSCQTWYT
jgi:hypothetical protein